MKPTFTRIVFFLILTILYQAVNAQTYNITSNSTWSSVITSGSCTGCTFNISSGVTLTFSSSAQCTNCTFNGGTVAFQSGSASSGFYSGNVFENEAVDFNVAEDPQGGTFTNDSVYVNGINLTIQTNTAVFTNSHIDLTSGGEITATSNVTATGSVFSLSGTAEYFNDGGVLTLSGSQMYLNGNSELFANSQVILENTSEVIVGDGTAASTAFFYYNTGNLIIADASMIKVSNHDNYYFNWGSYNYYTSYPSGTETSISTSTFSTTQNCGSGYPNACTTPYDYGCATLNESGIAPCTVLAIAEIDLTAVPAGANTAALTWSDPQQSTASRYQVQRSIGNTDWITISTVDAGSSTADYHYEDASAPAGTDDYRIVRIDQAGNPSYSIISSVTIAGTAGRIGIYPNPVTGHTFQLATGNTAQLTASIYTITGQLLMRTVLQGQTQYTVALPASLLPGTAVVAEVITTTGKQAFPLLLQ
jgi:hypothetical protein